MMTCPILCKQYHRWREELKDGTKKQWENVPRNPLHNLWKICYTPDLCSVFIGLILGTKKIKDRRTPTRLGNSY